MTPIFQDSVSSTLFWFLAGLAVALPAILLVLRRRTRPEIDLDAVRDPAFADLLPDIKPRGMFLGSLTSDFAGEPFFKARPELRAEMLRATLAGSVPCHCIGEIVAAPGVKCLGADGREVKVAGWDHFRD